MNITPDFTEAVESGAIPAGVYKARITGVEKKTSKAGNDYLNWKMTIFGAEGDAARQNNRVFFHITMIAGKGAGALKDLAKAAFGSLPDSWNTDEFIGKEVECVLADKTNSDGSQSSFPDVKAVRALHY